MIEIVKNVLVCPCCEGAFLKHKLDECSTVMVKRCPACKYSGAEIYWKHGTVKTFSDAPRESTQPQQFTPEEVATLKGLAQSGWTFGSLYKFAETKEKVEKRDEAMVKSNTILCPKCHMMKVAYCYPSGTMVCTECGAKLGPIPKIKSCSCHFRTFILFPNGRRVCTECGQEDRTI